jgi:hypothetical protein
MESHRRIQRPAVRCHPRHRRREGETPPPISCQRTDAPAGNGVLIELSLATSAFLADMIISWRIRSLSGESCSALGRLPTLPTRLVTKSWVAIHGHFVSRNSHGPRSTVVSCRETVMGRDPRSFRVAKQSWVAIHGRFMSRNSHGSRSTVVSCRETVMGRDPRSFRVAKQS